jgi:hypothetical protein
MECNPQLDVTPLRKGFVRLMTASRAGWLCLGVVLFSASAGCSSHSGPELIPVKGKVTIDGKPATEGSVMFSDMATGLVKPLAGIEADGSYSIMHNRQPGAPAGEYRVTVYVTETAKGPDGNFQGLPKTLSNAKFSDPKRTPLKVEVLKDAAPGAYDLAVTR